MGLIGVERIVCEKKNCLWGHRHWECVKENVCEDTDIGGKDVCSGEIIIIVPDVSARVKQATRYQLLILYFLTRLSLYR